ncbi:MAG: ABC transporter ATP-binding protein [Bilifractor sp.]
MGDRSWEETAYQPSDERISAEHVDFEYQGDSGRIKALSDVNFHIFPGEFVCVLGPSGCGKSTLLSLLAGFLRPSRGHVKLDGVEIDGVDWHRGVVFQNPPLYDWYTVRQNVAFGPRMRGIPKKEYSPLVDKYLALVQLSEFEDKHIYELSGGMKQRVSIARSLINDPDILLMDEPFGALDALTRESMQNLTRKIWWNTGKTVFFITHDVEEALLLGSRILVLSAHPGSIIENTCVDFSKRIIEENSTEVKFTKGFYSCREKLLKLIEGGNRREYVGDNYQI